MTLSDQLAIERGLEIGIYPGKWQSAQDMALRREKTKYPEESAFECACRFFVELGGGVKENFYGLLNAEMIEQK